MRIIREIGDGKNQDLFESSELLRMRARIAALQESKLRYSDVFCRGGIMFEQIDISEKLMADGKFFEIHYPILLRKW
jgi:hypothetical protein